MVVIIGALRFPPGSIARARPHLEALVTATRAKDGCLSYDVAEDLFDPGLIRFCETWPDQATLDRHLQAPHMVPWRAAVDELGLMGRDFTVYDAGSSRKL
ncbi:MAG TPA: putative quinol monooxygenase [Rhizomicrobium sp.]|nr:putative quinol monooxygenase [Rhizomicrobium sp.]